MTEETGYIVGECRDGGKGGGGEGLCLVSKNLEVFERGRIKH